MKYILHKATGDWRSNPEKLNKFNSVFKYSEVGILSTEDETIYEARGVLNEVFYDVKGHFLKRTFNWLSFFVHEPITTFIVTNVATGRGSSQYSTYEVIVDYLTGNVLRLNMLHQSHSSGFPKKEQPKFDDMRAALSEHVPFNPDYVIVWSAAYYVANYSTKFKDKGLFTASEMSNLPKSESFTDKLPFLDLFPKTPTLALRNISTINGNFKPGWGSGLIFPKEYRHDVYGDLGSGKWNLVKTLTGEVITSSETSIDDPDGSALRVNECLEKFFS